MNLTIRWITLAAALAGLSGIGLGAFGAHALRETLASRGTLPAWQTAVLYQLVHAVALLALAGWRDTHGGPPASVALCWLAGIVLFSGSLYGLALGGPAFLGPVTPVGGLAFLAGWALVARHAFRRTT